MHKQKILVIETSVPLDLVLLFFQRQCLRELAEKLVTTVRVPTEFSSAAHHRRQTMVGVPRSTRTSSRCPRACI